MRLDSRRSFLTSLALLPLAALAPMLIPRSTLRVGDVVRYRPAPWVAPDGSHGVLEFRRLATVERVRGDDVDLASFVHASGQAPGWKLLRWSAPARSLERTWSLERT